MVALALLPVVAGAQPGPSGLARFDFGSRVRHVDLPHSLVEISGLARTPGGRLLAHGDEVAVIAVLDPESGSVLRAFQLGGTPVPGDFEGIAIVRDRIFLATSTGWLYETRDVQGRTQMPYRVTDSGVGARCEVEGLAFDAAAQALVLACKTTTDREALAVLIRIPLDPAAGDPESLVLNPGDLTAMGHDPVLHPSGIEVDPQTGNFFVLAAREGLLLEVSPTGRIMDLVELPRRRHRQPEGIAFLDDGTLVIADEGDGRRGRLTFYGLKVGG